MLGFSRFMPKFVAHTKNTGILLGAAVVLSACSPERALPPGDIVSSITPMEQSAPGLPPVSNTIRMEGSEPADNVAVLEQTYIAPSPMPSNTEKKTQVAGLLSMPKMFGGQNRAESACQRQLRRLGVRFETPPPIVGPGSCGIANPVKVKSLSGGIDVVPDATINCPMALAFAKWVKGDLANAARVRYLSGIKSIHQMSAYSCRTMNSKKGARMSEHSKGNAIDIGKIKLNSGKVIVVRSPGLFSFREKSLLHKVRKQSCKYFTTVLGPGSDRHHADHFHFDLRQRKTSYRHCDL